MKTKLITHECIPNRWCAQCEHNVRYGGEENHPGNATRKAKPLTVLCANLGTEPIKVAGSETNWFECKLGIANKVNGKSICIQCNRQPVPGTFRIGNQYECGTGCKGYSVKTTST